MPSTEVVLRDDADKDVPLGQPGEICIRGPQVMAGYWQRPDETAKVIGKDGFLHTGDIGIMDEKGFIRIVDRKKDMILVSGFNVYPNEIEQVVAMHPGVLEVRGDRRARRAFGRGAQGVRGEEGPAASPSRTCSSTARRSSPATSGRSTSSSAPSCRRPTSARSCAARCATRRKPPEFRVRLDFVQSP